MDESRRRLRILLYADMRTSHALRWEAGLRDAGIDVRAVSSQLVNSHEVAQRKDTAALLRQLVVQTGINQRVRALAARSGRRGEHGPTNSTDPRVDPLQVLDTLLARARLRGQVRHLRKEASMFDPDVVHGLRIPYEGLTALAAVRERPVVISSWGQDFSLQASSDPWLRAWMERKLPSASGLHVDNEADIALAQAFGYSPDRPVLHAAGNFGVDRDLFYPGPRAGTHVILYPRGRRRYVRHQTFLAMVRAFRGRDKVRFIGVGLAGDTESEALARAVGPQFLLLTPELDRPDFARLMREASVVVSPATSDGTPNSLLEAFACGAFVMVGTTASTSALISPTVVGVSLDPLDAQAWVEGLMTALRGDALERALRINPQALPAPYDRRSNKARVPQFYQRVLGAQTGSGKEPR
jgi:glycosyltransferase involved in cell wall biosynthesis